MTEYQNDIPDLTPEERTNMERLLEAHAKDLRRALQQIDQGNTSFSVRRNRDREVAEATESRGSTETRSRGHV